MNLTLAAIVLAALPSTIVNMAGPQDAVRYIPGKTLDETVKKGMTPEAAFSQVVLAKDSKFQIYITGRDRNGQAEIHDSWNDNIFVQDGETSFVTGGVAVDAQVREPGETRGTSIKGGKTYDLHAGDYLFIPAGVPHQMIVKPGKRATFLDFKTHL